MWPLLCLIGTLVAAAPVNYKVLSVTSYLWTCIQKSVPYSSIIVSLVNNFQKGWHNFQTVVAL